MKFRSALLAATLLAAPLAAKAQTYTYNPGVIPGPYIDFGAGANIMSNQQIKSVTIPNHGQFSSGGALTIPLGSVLEQSRNVSMNAGFAGEGSFGWGFGPITTFGGPRIEAEGLYLNNAFNGGSNSTLLSNRLNFGGTEQKYGGFANFIWDFDLGTPFVYPYLGAGVGGLWSNWKSVRIYNNVSNNPNIQVNNTQGSFAYQGIIGAAFPIAPVPGLAITTDFRYESLVGHRNYSGRYTGTALDGTFAEGAGVTVNTGTNHNFTFLLGVKYAFNAAPPPPPPAPVVAPAPAPARSYLVFFDWDKYNLTDRARQIIAEAAQNSTRVQYTRIQVNGYTDTSGSAKYNMGLSIRRANAVAAELVRDGVPKNAIGIQGFGQTHLLVPTADNVREPQNRRVEIIIQ